MPPITNMLLDLDNYKSAPNTNINTLCTPIFTPMTPSDLTLTPNDMIKYLVSGFKQESGEAPGEGEGVIEYVSLETKPIECRTNTANPDTSVISHSSYNNSDTSHERTINTTIDTSIYSDGCINDNNNSNNKDKPTSRFRTRLTDEEKLRNKRERNRKAAANCRRRKEERIKSLEDEVVALKKHIAYLESRLYQNQTYMVTN